MTPDTRKLLDRCIEDGVAVGLRRAFKHTDQPTEDALAEEIQRAVMVQIDEWFTFKETDK